MSVKNKCLTINVLQILENTNTNTAYMLQTSSCTHFYSAFLFWWCIFIVLACLSRSFDGTWLEEIWELHFLAAFGIGIIDIRNQIFDINIWFRRYFRPFFLDNFFDESSITSFLQYNFVRMGVFWHGEEIEGGTTVVLSEGVLYCNVLLEGVEGDECGGVLMNTSSNLSISSNNSSIRYTT